MDQEQLTIAHRLQILATEHWSLLASRSLAWSESFNRATMFLATLSGAVVALALVAQASSFGRMFSVFALIILPVVLFVGVTTVIRMGAANYHDALCVGGMNRIRHAYLEIAPEMAPYFVMSSNDDEAGITVTMGLPPGMPFYQHLLGGTPTILLVINSVVSGVIGAIAASLATDRTELGVAAGIVGFVTSVVLHQRFATKSIERAKAGFQSRFPSQETSATT